jgi:hypothetical protein
LRAACRPPMPCQARTRCISWVMRMADRAANWPKGPELLQGTAAVLHSAPCLHSPSLHPRLAHLQRAAVWLPESLCDTPPCYVHVAERVQLQANQEGCWGHTSDCESTKQKAVNRSCEGGAACAATSPYPPWAALTVSPSEVRQLRLASSSIVGGSLG